MCKQNTCFLSGSRVIYVYIHTNNYNTYYVFTFILQILRYSRSANEINVPHEITYNLPAYTFLDSEIWYMFVWGSSFSFCDFLQPNLGQSWPRFETVFWLKRKTWNRTNNDFFFAYWVRYRFFIIRVGRGNYMLAKSIIRDEQFLPKILKYVYAFDVPSPQFQLSKIGFENRYVDLLFVVLLVNY